MTLNPRVTVFDDGSTAAYGATLLYDSTLAQYALGLFAPASRGVELCPGSSYPATNASYVCPYKFWPTGMSTANLPITVGTGGVFSQAEISSGDGTANGPIDVYDKSSASLEIGCIATPGDVQTCFDTDPAGAFRWGLATGYHSGGALSATWLSVNSSGTAVNGGSNVIYRCSGGINAGAIAWQTAFCTAGGGSAVATSLKTD